MKIQELIRLAFQEDIPQGDVTTENLGLPPRPGTARLVAKQDLVVSGYQLFEHSVLYQDGQAQLRWHFQDGDEVLRGQTICTIFCDLIALLKAERVALNFLMHLSGIATTTRKFVKLAKGSRTKVLDTRKTLPMYREWEKKAVRDGGGFNHRMSLSDAILIKDNHIALCGGITEAVTRVRKNTDLPITVEASTEEQVRESVSCRVERILLDNMTTDQIRKVLPLIPPQIEVEVSGNVNLENFPKLVELGIPYVSIGSITHSAPSADISLQFDWTML